MHWAWTVRDWAAARQAAEQVKGVIAAGPVRNFLREHLGKFTRRYA